MAWDGAGNFTRTNGSNTGATVWQQDEAGAVDIEADRHDAHDQDLAAGIEACLAKNGENAMTGDLDLGGNAIVNLSGFASLILTSTTAVDLSNGAAVLVVSPSTGQHLEMDGNTIQSKSNATTAATIEINALGGAVNVGPQSGTGSVSLYDAGTARVVTNSTGADVVGSVFDLNNSGAATAASILLRNSEGGAGIVVDGDALSIVQTDSAGAIEDTWASFANNAGVTLNYNNANRFSTTTNGIIAGSGADLSPSSAGVGHIQINASGYMPYLTADATAFYVGHNSASRSLVLQTDETDRITITSAGVVTLNFGAAAALKTEAAGAGIFHPSSDDPQLALRDNGGVALASLLHVGGNSLRLTSLDHGVPVQLRGEDTGGTARTLFNGDPDGESTLYYAGTSEAQTGSHNASDRLSGFDVKDFDGNLRNAGFLDLKRVDISADATLTDTHFSGKIVRHDSSTAHAVTLDNDATIPVDSVCMFVNGVDNATGAGVVTLTEGTGVTIRWFDGADVQEGNRTLGKGAVVSIYKLSDTVYMIWGAGIT